MVTDTSTSFSHGRRERQKQQNTLTNAEVDTLHTKLVTKICKNKARISVV